MSWIMMATCKGRHLLQLDIEWNKVLRRLVYGLHFSITQWGITRSGLWTANEMLTLNH
jgi:hypothetical protein